jgi:hypothetical protein
MTGAAYEARYTGGGEVGASPQILERSEQLFATHGPKAVFLGRSVAGPRVYVAWRRARGSDGHHAGPLCSAQSHARQTRPAGRLARHGRASRRRR